MIKAIIFDFDGTLTPLTLDFSRIRAEIVNIARKYAAEEVISKLEGSHIIEMIYEIEEGLNEGAACGEFQKEAFERLKILELEAAQGKDLYPYTRDVLKNLKAEEIRIGIITRTSIDVLKSVFADMESYISAVVARENTRYVKPNPLHALEALRMLGIAPNEAMMVGDHPTDVIAGNAAGMITAGVLAGRTQREAFEEVGATYILDDIRGILKLKSVM